MDITIRRATKSDISGLIRMNAAQADYHARLDPVFLKRGNELERARVRKYFTKEIARRNGRVFVAESGGKLMGYLMCEIQKMSPVIKDARIGYIRTLYVDGKARRLGVGTRLVQAAHEWIKEHGMRRIELGVLSNNPKGVTFWQKQGFKERMKRMWKRI